MCSGQGVADLQQRKEYYEMLPFESLLETVWISLKHSGCLQDVRSHTADRSKISTDNLLLFQASVRFQGLTGKENLLEYISFREVSHPRKQPSPQRAL